jgi:TatD DNase family protein
MYIDSHCHLNFKEFNDDLALVIDNAKKARVKKIVVPGASIQTSRKATQLAIQFPGTLYASVGCHPYEVMTYPKIGEIEQLITDQSPHEKYIVAIGECGLDYHPYEGFDAVGKKMEQKMLFEEHLLLALKYDLPVIIHCRDAFDEIFSVIDTLPTVPRGVFHCFSGGLSDVREITKRNFFIGFDGNITYNKHLRRIIPEIDPKHIILETDAPYLTPDPHRGTRNEPKFIPIIAKHIAELTRTDLSVIGTVSTKNSRSLFRLA